MPRLLRLAAGVCLAATVAACGTTVPVSRQASTGGAATGLGGDVAPPGASSSTDVAAGGAATADGTSPAGSGSGAGPVGSGPDAPPGSVLGPLATSRSKPIYVGITYVKDAAAAAQAFGFQGATLGDMERYNKILVEDLNKRGGLGGRKVVPVYFGYDANPGQPTWQQQDAAACAALTQDNHIEVGLVTFAGDVLNECLRKKGIPMIVAGATGGLGAASLRRFSQLMFLGGINLDRRAAEQVRALVRQKYFRGWDFANGGPGAAPTKVGIITYDLRDYVNAVNGSMIPGIVAAGYPKPQLITVAPHDSYDNISKMQAQISNAVLSFRASGVSHVIVYDDNGVATLFFTQTAESQKYRPRYGINSGSNMRVVAQVVNAEQLNGATGIGWVPVMDTTEAASPTSKYSNAARRRCHALMLKGEATGSGFNETSAMMYCASFFALEDRWEAMAQPSAAGLVASFEAFGSGFVDPNVPASWYGPGQHDGLGGVYDYAYDAACDCMKYTSGVRALARG